MRQSAARAGGLGRANGMSMTPQLVLHQEDHSRIVAAAQRLVSDANAKAVYLVDKDGQLVADSGELNGIDTTSLASLVAGSIAASGGLAKILGEDEFPVHFHQGKRDNVHITLVAQRIILVVIFDDRSSLGLVRLRVKKASHNLAQIFEEVFKKTELAEDLSDSPFVDITDEDIDNLFSD
jgi:predicted regulator of Ras-like GTPase activity (Roadblock/LC7/MglB family)